MSTRPPIPHAPRWRRFWKPAVATTAGGATLITWLEEIIATVVDFIGVIFIFIMAGVTYLFNIYVFKSAAPKVDNLKKK